MPRPLTMQTLSSPLSGILGDRYDRVLVMSTGAFIWGVMTSAMALTVTLRQVGGGIEVGGGGLLWGFWAGCCDGVVPRGWGLLWQVFCGGGLKGCGGVGTGMACTCKLVLQQYLGGAALPWPEPSGHMHHALSSTACALMFLTAPALPEGLPALLHSILPPCHPFPPLIRDPTSAPP
jgi:MFS family permease